MPNFGRGKVSRGVSLEEMVVGPIRRAGKVVRDQGEAGLKMSWKTLEHNWAMAGQLAGLNISTRCVEIPGFGISIRVPSLDSDSSQLTCPPSPAQRCAGCIVDAAFNPEGFPMEVLGESFAKACGKGPDCNNTQAS